MNARNQTREKATLPADIAVDALVELKHILGALASGDPLPKKYADGRWFPRGVRVANQAINALCCPKRTR